MELKEKGASAELEGTTLKGAIIKMKWTTEADFDLAVLIEKKSGGLDMCYYNNLGDLNAWPFMKLSGDAGVGDTGGDNEEQMKISQLDDDVAKAHIVVWDYGQVTAGGKARFDNSDVHVEFMDNTGTMHDVSLAAAGDLGNTVVLATIDNTSPMGAKLVNASKGISLKGIASAPGDIKAAVDAG